MWFSKLLNHRVHTLYRSFCLSVCKIKWHGVKIYLRLYLNSLKAKMTFFYTLICERIERECAFFFMTVVLSEAPLWVDLFGTVWSQSI